MIQFPCRKIQNEDLQTDYNNPNDDTIRNYIYIILSIAFVSLSDEINEFEELLEKVLDQFVWCIGFFLINYLLVMLPVIVKSHTIEVNKLMYNSDLLICFFSVNSCTTNCLNKWKITVSCQDDSTRIIRRFITSARFQ